MKKALVLMLAVLLVGLVGMAKTKYFESAYFSGDITVAGTATITVTGFATLDVGGGYGSTGVSISATGVYQGDGGITSDATITGLTLTDGTLSINSGYISSVQSISATTLTDGTFIVSGGTVSAGTWEGSVVDHERGGLEADVNAYDGLVRITGGSTSAATVTANALTLLASTNFLSMTQDLSVEIGVDVQAQDDELTDLAGLTFADDQFIIGTGAGTIGMASCTVFAQSILDDADASTVRGTLGLGTIATQAADVVDIDGGAIDGTAIGANSETTGAFSTLTTTNKVRFGAAQGATAINMDGTDPDQTFQIHADIDSDVTSGAFSTLYGTMTLSNSTTNDSSIFSGWTELYVTGDITLAKGNLAGSWGHLELVDGGGGNLTLNAVSDVYQNWAGGVVGSLIVPDTLIVGAHRSLAAVVATAAIASGYSVNADGELAGILIRADDQPFPVGLLIDDDDATIDIQLSTDQYIDGSTAGVASVAGDSAVEYVAGCMRTVITVDSSSAGDDIDLEDKDDGGGTLLYTFPVGHIRIFGVVADLTTTSSAEIFQATFPMSIGTTAGADSEATLTGTEADLCASTAISYDGAVACDLPPVSSADMTYDGTSSAVVVYLNAAVANADINGAATVKSTGTVTIHWMLLGDY